MLFKLVSGYWDRIFTCKFQVLNAGDDAVGLEQLEEDADDISLHKARRSMGSMSAMSGANGMVYMEYRYSYDHVCLDHNKLYLV